MATLPLCPFKKFLAALSVVVLVAISSTSSAAPIPAEALFSKKSVSDIALSPDGTRLAYIKNFGDQSTVKIIDLNTMEETTRYGPKWTNIDWVEWATNDRLLISQSDILLIKRRNRYYKGPVTKVFSVGSRIGDVVEIFSDVEQLFAETYYRKAIVDWLHDDPDHVLIPVRAKKTNELHKVNILTAKTEKIAEGSPNTYHWITNPSGVPQFRMDIDKSGTFVEIFELEPSGAEWKRITSVELNDDEPSDDFWPLAPTDQENQFLVLARPPDREFSAILKYDTQTEEFVSVEYQTPGADIRGAIISSRTGKTVGAYYYGDRYQEILDDQRAMAHRRGLEKFFDNDANIRFVDGTINGALAIFYVSSPTIPGDYYLYSYEDSHIEGLFAQSAEVSPDSMGKTEIIQYTARDGYTLTGYLTHPTGKEPADFAPLVVMPHGGPEVRDYYDYSPEVQFLASRGYRVFQMNFRGSSGYGKSHALAGYGEWGGMMQNDMVDGFLTLVNEGIASPEKTCIVGASYGGYVALYGATNSPELFRCAVSVAGVSDLNLMMKSERAEHGADSPRYQYWLDSIGNPSKDRENLKQKSPLTFVNELQTPVLLIHGTADRVVPIEQSRIFHKQALKANKPVELIELEEEGHSRWSRENSILYMNQLESFLSQHISSP